MLRHPFHLVEQSPWPLATALSGFRVITGLLRLFYDYSWGYFLYSLALFTLVLALWWRDVIREGTFLGHHTSYVCRGLRIGIVLFLFSEAMFFMPFFWALFHSALCPVPEIGCTWPPIGIETINPIHKPLFNTIVLLTSGISVTWAHHALLEGNREDAIAATTLTALLGILFTVTQLNEYHTAHFTMCDGIYGSIFYVATGFHGLHVTIGTIFLLTNLYRITAHHFSTSHHLGFEFGAWYWHFVDIVWICLYLCLYWWGS